VDAPPETPGSRRVTAFEAALIVGLALIVRVAVLSALPAHAISADVNGPLRVVYRLETGGDPYDGTSLVWPPFWLGVIWFVLKAAHALHSSFVLLLKLLLGTVDGATIALVLVRLRQFPAASPGRRVLLALALNPACILLVCQHANADVFIALWVLLAIGALLAWMRDHRPRDWLLACLFLGLGIFTKTVPLILSPLLLAGIRRLDARARILGALLFIGPVTLGMAYVALVSSTGVANILHYRSMHGWFGVTGLCSVFGARAFDSFYRSAFIWLVLLVLASASRYVLRVGELEGRALVLLAALLLMFIPALGPGFGTQYVTWSLPLLVLIQGAFGPRFRALVIAFQVVVVLTYVPIYALSRFHGVFLLESSNPAVIRGIALLSERRPMAIFTLPLFAAHLAVLAAGVVLLHRSAAAKGLTATSAS
jgi:hypothetical protein